METEERYKAKKHGAVTSAQQKQKQTDCSSNVEDITYFILL